MAGYKLLQVTKWSPQGYTSHLAGNCSSETSELSGRFQDTSRWRIFPVKLSSPVGSRAQLILTKFNELLHEHLTSMDSAISQLQKYIPFDASQRSLWISIASIAFNPTAWNIVARNEHRNRTLTRKVFRGNARMGCYFLTVLIFSFGMLRDSLYTRALIEQPKKAILPQPWDTIVPAALAIIGQIFVLTSTWQLGITGTFLGDYFGILMDSKVEGFPFNVLRDPMYVGSTMCFAAGALWYERPAGLLITLYVYIVYVIALRFEGPFTDMIYSTRERLRAGSGVETKKEL